MNPTAKPLPIELDGKRYTMHFNLNTFSRFEELTGKSFFEFIASLQDAALPIISARTKKKASEAQALKDMMDFLRKVSGKDLQAAIHASIHVYDTNNEPHWPLSMGHVGRLITPNNFGYIVTQIMTGHSKNNVQAEDITQKEDEDGDRPTRAGLTPADGGPEFGPSDEDVLASLTRK